MASGLSVWPISSRSENGIDSSSSFRDSIFEKSRMSLRMASSESADDLTVIRQSRCCSFGSLSSASSVMPMMPFIGVRISWLMLARNSLLARLASMARSRADDQERVRGPQLAGACVDGVLELFLVLDQTAVPLADFDQHVVEAVHELADFVVPGGFDPHVVAMVARHRAGDVGQPQQRRRDDALQPARQDERQADAAEQRDDEDAQRLPAAVDAAPARSDST